MNRTRNAFLAAAIALAVLTRIAGAAPPSPAGSVSNPVEPLLEALAAKYETAQPESALVDAVHAYVDLDSLADGVAGALQGPATREAYERAVDPSLHWSIVDRAPEAHAGVPVRWKGTVLNAREVKGQTFLQAYHEGSRDAFVVLLDGASAALPGQAVTVYGQIVGPWAGKNAFGVELRQTLVRARFVDAAPAPAAAAVPAAAPAAAPVPAPAAACVADSAFTADMTVPDHTLVQPGQRFDKVWRMKNTGACAWGEGYRLAFAGGAKLGTVDAAGVPATAPGRNADLLVPMVAPSEPGSYQAVFQLQGPDGKTFGHQASVIVQVAGAEPAPAPASSAPAAPAAPAGKPAPKAQAPAAERAPAIHPMNEAFTIGPWQVRAVELNRQPDVWKYENHWVADGVYALVRMKVTYTGNQTAYMSEALTFQAMDDQDRSYTMRADARAGDAARWMVSNQASTGFAFQPGTTDWPVMVAFDVEKDVKELWLTATDRETGQQEIIHLQPTESKSQQTFGGRFETAAGLD